MERQVDVSVYWRDAVAVSEEFKKIAQAENPEFLNVWQGYERMMNNQFIDTADSYGVEKWEKFLNIIPYSTDTLNVRKIRIKTILKGDLPYTWKSLVMKLKNAVGSENFDIHYYKNKFLLEIRLHLNVKEFKATVKNLLEKILPANIIFNIDFAYNRHIRLKEFTHEELGLYTHEQLRAEILRHIVECNIASSSFITLIKRD